jgi:hypothetical protein
MYYHRGGNSANKSRETEKLPNICVVGGCSNMMMMKNNIYSGMSNSAIAGLSGALVQNYKYKQ